MMVLFGVLVLHPLKSSTFGTPRAFDGDTSTLAATGNASNANILFTKTFNNVTKLRIYMDHDYTAYRVRVNGGSWHVDDTLGATQNAGWRDLTSPSQTME